MNDFLVLNDLGTPRYADLNRFSNKPSQSLISLINKLNDDVKHDLYPSTINEYNSSENKDISHLGLHAGRVWYRNKEIGRYKEISYNERFIACKCSIEESLKVAREAYAQCTTVDNSSNSPSMMYHQLCSITLGCMIKGKVSWEESYGSYTPDLLFTKSHFNVLIDVTGSNVKMKLDSMPKCPAIVIDKYKFLDTSFDKHDVLKVWSSSNDKNDMDFMYSLIKEQASHNEMLYDSSFLKFFSGQGSSLSLEKHSVIASEMLMITLEEEKYEEKKISDMDLNNKISEFAEEFDSKEDHYDNDYFIFPNKDVIDMEPLREYDVSNDDPHEYIVDGFIDYGTLNENKEIKLFEESSVMFISSKTYESIMGYPADKNNKRMFLHEYYDRLTKEYGYRTDAWQHMLKERVFQKLGISIDKEHYEVFSKVSKDFRPTEKKRYCFDFKTSFILKVSQKIDPDHELLLQNRSCHSLITMLSICRDYHELRFKSRVAISIMYNKKPEKCFKVKHWKYDNLYALVKIKGLILEKDKGVAYVSYFDDSDLIRTEKWRLPDVENYSIAHHRLICILCSMTKNLERNLTYHEINIISRIMCENSWGLSKYLKVYRYLSSGICMESTEVVDTLKKLKKTIDGPVKRKLSFMYMIKILKKKSKAGKLKYGKTPLFDLDFKNLGWESFLVNLCPSNTYGKLRHLESTVTELADEIDLYNKNFCFVKELFDDFKGIMSEVDENELRRRYYNHLKMVKSVSGKTDGRFTFSPVSLVMIHENLNSYSYHFKHFQGSVPNLSKLMTAKANTKSYTGEPSLAIQSIAELSNIYKTSSTSELSLYILNKLRDNKKIDLIMRLFDKDQVGGDREISILNSEFRVLQSVVESFFEKWASITGIDKLHSKTKVQDLINSYENTITGKHSICLTADQTRWGPNFNTCIFGFLSLMISSKTTESYIPALICFLSEFKVFEMPSWVPNVFNRSDYFYSIIGKLGRSHMGQGIFHQSSSLYHTMVISYLKGIIKSLFKKENHPDMTDIEYIVDAFVTSDDIALIIYFYGDFGNKTIEQIESIFYVYLQCKLLLSNSSLFFMYFGIKTSSYKNIISKRVEFNSIHVGDNLIASTDMKFCYSLVDPGTTGNFLSDFYSTYDTYVSARNSLCSHDTAVIISYCSLLKFCRQWKLNFKYLNFQRESDLISGIPKPIITDYTSEDEQVYLKTQTNLHFKTRKYIEGKIDTGNKILDSMVTNSLLRIKGTRERSSYRSILTYSKSNTIWLNSDYFTSHQSAIGETYMTFCREMLHNPDHLLYIINHKYQTAFSCYPEDHESRPGYIKHLKLRDSVHVDLNLFELIASHYPLEKYMSLDSDKLQLHMIRKHKVLNIKEPLFDSLKFNFVDALTICDQKIRDLALDSTDCDVFYYDGTNKPIKYQKYVYYPPRSLNFTRKNIGFKYCLETKDLDKNKRYFSNRVNEVMRIKFSDKKLIFSHEMGGTKLPLITLAEKDMGDITRLDLMSFDFKSLKEDEVKYQQSKEGKIYLNFKTTKKRIDAKMVDTISSFSEKLSMDEIQIRTLALADMDDFDDDVLKDLAMAEEKDDDNELAEELNVESVESLQLNTYSCEIDQSYGVLCNPSWVLKIMILDRIVSKMISEGIIYYQSWRKANIFDWNSSSIAYVFDKNMKKKIEMLLHSSKISIRQDMEDLGFENVKTILVKIISGSESEIDILDMLLRSYSFAGFSESALGKEISRLDMISLIRS